MFFTHLWLGVAGTVVLVVVTVTGIFLNHKRGLGFMSEVQDQPAGMLAYALSLDAMVARAREAVGSEIAAAGIDRIDVRPGSGLAKVRFKDRRVLEVSLNIHTGEILHLGERNDVFLEKLHSGEIFGNRWILLSDASAMIILVMLISGYWLWLFPKSRL